MDLSAKETLTPVYLTFIALGMEGLSRGLRTLQTVKDSVKNGGSLESEVGMHMKIQDENTALGLP